MDMDDGLWGNGGVARAGWIRGVAVAFSVAAFTGVVVQAQGGCEAEPAPTPPAKAPPTVEANIETAAAVANEVPAEKLDVPATPKQEPVPQAKDAAPTPKGKELGPPRPGDLFFSASKSGTLGKKVYTGNAFNAQLDDAPPIKLDIPPEEPTADE